MSLSTQISTDPISNSKPSSGDGLFIAKNVYTSVLGTNRILNSAAIVVKNGLIVWLGKEQELPDDYQTQYNLSVNHQKYDFSDGWLTTGLIDCHTHLVYGGNRANEFRQRLEGVSYQQIAENGGGILSTVNATRQASEQQLLDSALGRLRQLESEGVSCVEIKSGYGLDLENEIKMLRVIQKMNDLTPTDLIATCLAAHALPNEYKDKADEYINLICEQILPVVNREQLASAVDAFCENIGFNTDQVSKVFSKAKSLGFDIKLHAEQLSDQGGSQLAASFNALSVDHLEHISQEGIHAIHDSSTVAVLLPGAYYFLGETHCPPIDELRNHNIPIAIATDSNPGSSPCTSILLMLNMACTLFKLTVDEALLGVTRNAAQALGIHEKQGQIKEGMKADFVHWNINDIDELCYNFGSNPCNRRFKNGLEVKH